jgi:hypothetical protein
MAPHARAGPTTVEAIRLSRPPQKTMVLLADECRVVLMEAPMKRLLGQRTPKMGLSRIVPGR